MIRPWGEEIVIPVMSGLGMERGDQASVDKLVLTRRSDRESVGSVACVLGYTAVQRRFARVRLLRSMYGSCTAMMSVALSIGS